jgi:trans-2,3-dihydro-3-hydroxyanthranilate isomerase
MRVAFRLVDVFTERPLAGNQLCVVPDPVPLEPDLMQALALEIGFAETTFVTAAEGDRYAMRIFTPGQELPFAGHPSLGTAFVLVREGRVTSPAVQSVAAGEYEISVDLEGDSARMRQRPPTFGVELERGMLAEALGLAVEDLHPEMAPTVVSTGLPHLMCPAASADAVAAARPDAARLGELLASAGAGGCYLFAYLGGAGVEPGHGHGEGGRGEGERGGVSAKARLFAPGLGVNEDPATGSAAGPLGAFLAQLGVMPPGRLRISQGEELRRPSTLLVDVEPDGGSWSVFVGGGVAVVGEGAFELPG